MTTLKERGRKTQIWKTKRMTRNERQYHQNYQAGELIKYILNTDEKTDILEYGPLIIQNPVQWDKEIRILKENKEK